MSNLYCNTDAGRVRLTNEDVALALKNQSGDILLMIADGIGGQKKGEVASQIAMEAFESFAKKKRFLSAFFAKKYLISCAIKANTEIKKMSHLNLNYHKMATTLVVVLIRQNQLLMLNVGDSRAYIKHEFIFRQLSEDHTYLNYQKKHHQGDSKMSEHVLVNALGVYSRLHYQFLKMPYHQELVFLCSDGIHHYLKDDVINDILNIPRSLEERCQLLFQTINAQGGLDNMAVAVYDPRK
jgi:protein phosphatase